MTAPISLNFEQTPGVGLQQSGSINGRNVKPLILKSGEKTGCIPFMIILKIATLVVSAVAAVFIGLAVMSATANPIFGILAGVGAFVGANLLVHLVLHIISLSCRDR